MSTNMFHANFITKKGFAKFKGMNNNFHNHAHLVRI